jgi:predicted MFS family arabinose efflux permease
MFHGWRVVGVCFIAAVFTWGFGVFGSSVYLSEITRAHDWPTSVVSAAITVFFLTNAIVLPAISAGIGRFGPRYVISGGALLLGAGIVAVGRLEELWQLFAAFACMGIGYATMSVTGLSATIAPWFERHQGRSIALALTGASVGAMVVVPLLVMAIASWGFAEATIRSALLVVVCMLPLSLVVLRFRGPGELGLGKDGTPGRSEPLSDITDKHKPTKPIVGRRSWALWSVTIAFSLGLVVQVGFLTHHFALALPSLGSLGAGWLIGATGLAGLLGRLLLAKVVDRLDPRRYSAGVFAVQVAALGAISVFPSDFVLVVGSLVYGFCLGQITTLSPIVVRREFGADEFAAMYGVAGTAIQFCSAFGPAFYGALFEYIGGYGPVLGIAAGFELAAALVILSYRRRGE